MVSSDDYIFPIYFSISLPLSYIFLSKTSLCWSLSLPQTPPFEWQALPLFKNVETLGAQAKIEAWRLSFKLLEESWHVMSSWLALMMSSWLALMTSPYSLCSTTRMFSRTFWCMLQIILNKENLKLCFFLYIFLEEINNE